ncbi:MAG: hypothetical protein ACK559_27525, partial [bacterium]
KSTLRWLNMQNYLAGNFPHSRSCLPEIYCILLFYIHFTVLQGYIYCTVKLQAEMYGKFLKYVQVSKNCGPTSHYYMV